MDRRRLIPIFLIVFVNFLGASIVQPVLPLYAQSRFDASPETISILLASFFVAQFLAAPILGRLSDRYGRLPILIISQIGTFLSFLILGGAASLPMLFFGRILDGITGGNVIVAQAYITDITPRQHRTQALGVIFSAFGLGYVLGPALGGFIGGTLGDQAAFMVGAVASLITVILTWIMLDESLPLEKRLQRQASGRAKLSFGDVLANHTLLLIMLIGFGAQFSIALLTSTIALFGERVIFEGYNSNAVHIGNGLILAGFGIAQVITQFFLVKRLVGRFGEHRLIVIGAVFRSIGMFSVVALTSPFWVGGVAMPIVAIASGIMMPAVQSLATTSVAEEVNGAALGWYQSAVSIGIIIGTAVGGQLFAQEPTFPYIVGGMVLALVTIPAVLLMRRVKPLAAPAIA